jgi:hypothetical protein
MKTSIDCAVMLYFQIAAARMNKYLANRGLQGPKAERGRRNTGATTQGFGFYTAFIGAHPKLTLAHAYKVDIDTFLCKAFTVANGCTFKGYIELIRVICKLNEVRRTSLNDALILFPLYSFTSRI